ncbi:MAG TPA: hypothetical protein PKE29_18040 [Phycisphaerales bacterium]|nr:hypothetical protein [Phycisphaerales bacterium]
MENVPVFVGPEDHCKSLQVCVVDKEGTVPVNRTCGNSVAEIDAAIGAGRMVARPAVENRRESTGRRRGLPACALV